MSRKDTKYAEVVIKYSLNLSMNDRNVFRFVMLLSIVVFALVVVLNRKLIPAPTDIPAFVYQLPKLHALLNGTCAILLLASLSAIKKGKVQLHKKLNLTAFVLSAVFLISYVTYHYLAAETRYPEDNPLRYLYLFILISHIVLAALVLPLILMSFYYGLQQNHAKHKKLVRWSFPIWLYVTITGVVVYLMISPFYTHG